MLKEYDEKRTGSVLYNIGLLASYNYNRNNSQAFELYYELQKTIKALEMQGPPCLSAEVPQKFSGIIPVQSEYLFIPPTWINGSTGSSAQKT